MNHKEMLELRDYYDNHESTPEEMEQGHWETDVDPNPMVTSSLRLPKALLDVIRAVARARGMRATALMRQILEESLAPGDGLPQRVARLEQDRANLIDRLAKLEDRANH